MRDIYRFLNELRANNNREWFNLNKERYLDIKSKTDLFVTRLTAAIAEWEPAAARLAPSDCTYRIYRDTRFSADKTPYKTHIGIYVCPGGNKKSYRCGYYVHIEPGASFLGGGCWCPHPALLKEVRQSIFDNCEEYLEIIRNPEFTSIYKKIGDNPLKTAPKGFPKDWEHIDLIKPRDYTALAPVPDTLICSDDAVERISADFLRLKPYNDFLNYIFEEKPWLADSSRGR